MLGPIDPSQFPAPVARILGAPPKMQEMAAKGIAPGLRPADLVLLLTYYATQVSVDPTLAEPARKTLSALPEPVLQGAIGTELAPHAIHEIATRYHTRVDVLERVLAMRTTAPETVEEVAGIGSELICEYIATNEERLLQNPRIIEKLYLNKHTRMSTADRLIELAVRNRVELNLPAWKEAAAAIVDELIAEPTGDEPSFDDVLFKETQQIAEHIASDDDEDAFDADDEGNENLREKFAPLMKQLAQMTSSQKVRLASMGNKEARMLLVRDSNRLVAVAAVRNPGFSMAEAEKVAGNRSISEDVLRVVGGTPEFTQSYVVKKALAENPKSPMMIALKMITHLREHDLKGIARSKNVTGPVQEAARRHLDRRKK